ncbi:endonuclease/exonuclease/phosphatase family protein [Persicitalea jodogahamensis]|uniref:Endonuclease n=1 Tax=Persicitalea jodogahamensis TaxID=402147 RepID=A0A8J3D2K1_9BACT|nr:endonuclease/exonuclease/phosphatase family protein [Persicitalea jodogahamensis]GHB59496.1 endonuclease [Persicitalea jodogahamensis]
MYLSNFLYFTGGIIILATLIPFIRSDYWVFRIFEYPRAQKWFITTLILALFIALTDLQTIYQWGFLAALVANLAYLTYQIFPFLPIASLQMKSAGPNAVDGFSLMISNVLQYNEDYGRLLALIDSRNPDIIVLSETGHDWAKAMEAIHENYPYRESKVLDNTYGIMLFSRLEITESEVRYLVEKDIPSIFALIKLADGNLFQLFCIHPTPPVPGENVRSTERDKEILMVGKLAKKSPLPVIVSGDLNDVAWSYTNQLFQNTSGLLDPRRGRGFYNTFHAKYPFFRYPLDHIFCSTHFQLMEIERLPSIGSDHFPMWIKLAYVPVEANEQETPDADAEDEELADEKISKPT